MCTKHSASNIPNSGLSAVDRTLHDSDLTFVTEYTQKPLGIVRSNTLDVWQQAKEQVAALCFEAALPSQTVFEACAVRCP